MLLRLAFAREEYTILIKYVWIRLATKYEVGDAPKNIVLDGEVLSSASGASDINTHIAEGAWSTVVSC